VGVASRSVVTYLRVVRHRGVNRVEHLSNDGLLDDTAAEHDAAR